MLTRHKSTTTSADGNFMAGLPDVRCQYQQHRSNLFCFTFSSLTDSMAIINAIAEAGKAYFPFRAMKLVETDRRLVSGTQQSSVGTVAIPPTESLR